MKTHLLLATRNRHKVAEIQAIVGSGYVCEPLDALAGAPAIVEDGDTFAANALRKSRGIAAWLSGRKEAVSYGYVLADDSGLEVDALDGAPGVHSARFAAGEPGVGDRPADADNNAKLLRLLKDVPVGRRQGRFRCVMAVTPIGRGAGQGSEVGDSVLFDGACEGSIDLAPRGHRGFGYDPLFIPDGFAQSFAELGDEVKNRISHRARALEGLRRYLHQS